MKRVSTPLIFIIRASVEERMSLSKTPKPRFGSKATSGSDGTRLLGWDVEPDEAHWCRAVFVCFVCLFSSIFLTRPRSRAPEGLRARTVFSGIPAVGGQLCQFTI